ncbi:MAG: tRNA lysidine(34) synthetase TilS [Candidatus Omnitrophota bacterium]
MDLAKRVLEIIKQQELIRLGDTIVIGVSGGPDSVALLYVLYKLRISLGFKLHIAHFNHRLRPGADQDEVFVRDFAVKLDLPISVSRRKGSIKKALVSEDKARRWRFKFFIQVAHRVKAQAIALAHTQNDLAETVLMRLLRGTGLMGLRGILSERQMEGVRLIRPFLSIQRLQIEQYFKVNKLGYCIDETNQQPYFLRNKIRLQLMPMLMKDYSPNFPSLLVDLAYSSGADYEYLLDQAQLQYKMCAVVSKSKVKITIKSLLKQPLSIRRMLFRLSFEHLAKNLNQLSFVHLNEVEDLLATRPVGSIVSWPKSIRVIKLKDQLVFIL